MKGNKTMKYIIPILSLIISVIALAVALPRPNIWDLIIWV